MTSNSNTAGLPIVRAIIAHALGKAPGEAETFAVKAWGEASLAARIAANGGLMEVNLAKAAIKPGTTVSGGWGAVLAEADTAIVELFGLVRARSVLGRIAGMRKVPNRVKAIGQSSGFSAAWIGEGKPIPVSSATFAATNLAPMKLASLIVQSEEFLRAISPENEQIVQNDLVGCIAEAVNTSFLDPTNGGSAGIEPASVTYGAPTVTSTGDSVGDLKALVNAFVNAGGDLTTASLVGSPQSFVGLHDGLFLPALGANGGSALGIPAVACKQAGDVVALIDGSAVAWTGGAINFTTSREGSIEMTDSPTQNGLAGTGSEMVSLWTDNLVGIMAELQVNWEAQRPAAATLSAVAQS